MEVKILRTKKELEIYMNPVRQEIIRELTRAGEPVTPKFISDRLGISPSSIQFHIRKLEELGVVELAYTRLVRGIRARYFQPSDVIVSIGNMGEGCQKERELVLENSVRQVFEGCCRTFQETEAASQEEMKEKSRQYGDILTGVAFLTDEEADVLMGRIQDFLKEHRKKKEGTKAWEYGLLAYKMKETKG